MGKRIQLLDCKLMVVAFKLQYERMDSENKLDILKATYKKHKKA